MYIKLEQMIPNSSALFCQSDTKNKTQIIFVLAVYLWSQDMHVSKSIKEETMIDPQGIC